MYTVGRTPETQKKVFGAGDGPLLGTAHCPCERKLATAVQAEYITKASPDSASMTFSLVYISTGCIHGWKDPRDAEKCLGARVGPFLRAAERLQNEDILTHRKATNFRFASLNAPHNGLSIFYRSYTRLEGPPKRKKTSWRKGRPYSPRR